MQLKELRKFIKDNAIVVPLAGTKEFQLFENNFKKLVDIKFPHKYSGRQLRRFLQKLSTASHSYRAGNIAVKNGVAKGADRNDKHAREMGRKRIPRDIGPNRITF